MSRRKFVQSLQIMRSERLNLVGLALGLISRSFQPSREHILKVINNNTRLHLLSNKHLPVESQNQKHQKKARNMFKVNHKNTRTASMTYCKPCLVLVFLFLILNIFPHLFLVFLLLILRRQLFAENRPLASSFEHNFACWVVSLLLILNILFFQLP